MRLVDTIKDPQVARDLSAFFKKKNIENELEQGKDGVRIWIVDEDDVESANQWLSQYHQNPHEFQFDTDTISSAQIPILTNNSDEEVLLHSEHKHEPQAYATLGFIIICIILFAASFLTAPKREAENIPYPQVAIYGSEVTQGLLFDFPKAYELLSQIVTTYGIGGLKDPTSMPPAGQALLLEYNKTPYWQGFYQEFVLLVQGKQDQAWELQAPLFEKIRQGEIWRLFSPALLHLDIFHLLFNMLWLYVLGKQIEIRIGLSRYLLFCLGVGIFANIVQYLISGANFIGFSGILCGFFTFIWMRQKLAPWEGYRLDRSTIVMIGIFVGGLFLIQVASFLTEVYANTSIAPMIANAAHIAGGIAGWVLGRYKFFAWKQ